MHSVLTPFLTRTACALALAAALAAPAAAQMYTYKDPVTGTRILSNTPPPEGVQARALAPEDRSDSPLLSAAPVVLPDPPAPARRPVHDEGPRPVDTTTLGNITRGMSQETVRQRLGAPASIRPEGTVKRVRHTPLGGTPIGMTPVEVVRETWVYPGNSQIPTAEITFEGGQVVNTARAR